MIGENELIDIKKIIHQFDIGSDNINECVNKLKDYINKLFEDHP